MRLAAAFWNRDRMLVGLLVGGVVLNAALWLYVGLRLRFLPEVLPIHYNSAGQADRIGFRTQLFILPMIGLVTVVANIGLGVLLYSRDRSLTYVLLVTAVLVELLVGGATVQLIH
jgi:uncharacterized membrane protein